MAGTFQKECQHHGVTAYRYVKRNGDPRGREQCCKCQAESVARRRDKVKIMALEYKGMKCQHCGYDKCKSALEFHHLNPAEKDFAIGYKGETRSWTRTKAELDKCVLLCSNCHREEHERLETIGM